METNRQDSSISGATRPLAIYRPNPRRVALSANMGITRRTYGEAVLCAGKAKTKKAMSIFIRSKQAQNHIEQNQKRKTKRSQYGK